MSEQLGREYGKNLAHTEMLQVQDKPGSHMEPSPSLVGAPGTSKGGRNRAEWALVMSAVQCGVSNSV